MAGRPCVLCANPSNAKLAADMIASAASDQVIADKIGGVSRMAVARHRKNHIERPARAVAAAAAKGLDVRKEREQLIQAVENGDAAATFLGLNQITTDLRTVHDRLARVADAAEAGGQLGAVAPLSAQQIKALETRAKLGGLQGFTPPKAGPVAATTFVLNIQFSGRTERIEAVGMPVIDATPLADEEEDTEIEDEDV